jgi:V/A-type H+/Na+-transporting ATPase subunit E
MALTDILEKINQEAQKQAEKLTHEFEQEKKKLEAENQIEIKSSEENLKALFNQQEHRIKNKAEMEAEQTSRNKILKAKRQFIDDVLQKSVAKLAESEKYEDILADTLSKMEKFDEAEIVPAKGKEEVTKKAISKSGRSFMLSQHSAPIKGGFILKTEKVEMDNSFETIIGSQLRHSLEIELNKLLFA